MDIPVIGFIPPMGQVYADFNTFRMGKRWSKLYRGKQVLLLNEKEQSVFGTAVVLEVHLGKCNELCAMYAHENHTRIGIECDNHPEELYATLKRIYGPHILTPTKTFTVVKLRRRN